MSRALVRLGRTDRHGQAATRAARPLLQLVTSSPWRTTIFVQGYEARQCWSMLLIGYTSLHQDTPTSAAHIVVSNHAAPVVVLAANRTTTCHEPITILMRPTVLRSRPEATWVHDMTPPVDLHNTHTSSLYWLMGTCASGRQAGPMQGRMHAPQHPTPSCSHDARTDSAPGIPPLATASDTHLNLLAWSLRVIRPGPLYALSNGPQPHRVCTLPPRLHLPQRPAAATARPSIASPNRS